MASIEIDGKKVEVENGQMIIEVADSVDIKIPRFCYHKKLSVAANCRMCLVEIENGRKPVPACATPITDGMKVYTKSKGALEAQKAVMEFLLINHPLDCPICDQGGECELQDVSMGYGDSQSDYGETKRSFDDDDLGALISTEMTRCIHCTRCVRFGDEVAGMRELGATGRGESTQIGTFVKHSMKSEVSANVIDLCPVGALTSKPYRYSARAWELQQHESIAPHDCLGSNLYAHVRREQLMRVVPRENEELNETWLSDRDRFSYLGMSHENRLSQPLIKRNGQWEAVTWAEAIEFAANGMKKVIETHGPQQFAGLASPSSTLEELYLMQKLLRAQGVNNLDHRLHQVDFDDQAFQAECPRSDLSYESLDKQSCLLLVGTHLHREVPLAAVRVRKAYLKGAAVMSINPMDYDFPFDCQHKTLVSSQEMPMVLARLVVALQGTDKSGLNEGEKKLLLGVKADKNAKEMAVKLREGGGIVTGALLENHPHASSLRTLIGLIKRLSGAKHLRLTEGSNAAGAWLAGMVPHRSEMGREVREAGLNALEAIESRLKGYLLMGVEPGFDFVNPSQARQSILGAEFVVMVTAFQTSAMLDYAHVLLPCAPFTETSGTYVNVDGDWQTFKGVTPPHAEARPAWKILRVLANTMDAEGFEYTSSREVTEELKTACDLMVPGHEQTYCPDSLPAIESGITRLGEWPLYRVDSIVRHSNALQACGSNDTPCLRVHPKTAIRLKLDEVATVSQGDIEITLPLKRDERLTPDVVWVPNALLETGDLGHSFAPITIKR